MGVRVPSVSVVFPNRRALLASYRVDGENLSVFVPTGAEAGLGTPITLEIGFGDCERSFLVTGLVTWRRAQARSMKLEAGLGVAFSGKEKYEAAQMLAFCAGRPLVFGTSADQRVSTKIRCTVEVGRRSVAAQVRDLSVSGAFVASPRLEMVPSGTPLQVVLNPGWLFGWGGQQISAKAVWSGTHKGPPGCGIRFLGDPSKYRPGLKGYLGTAAMASALASGR